MKHAICPRLLAGLVVALGLAATSSAQESKEWTISKRRPDEWLSDYRRAAVAQREELVQQAFVAVQARFGPEALATLLPWLEDPDAVVRAVACELLRLTDDPKQQAVAPLRRHAEDVDPIVRLQAAFALLVRLNEHEPALSLFCRLANDGDVVVRRQAVQFLEFAALNELRGEPRAKEALLAAVHDTDATIRHRAVWGLSRYDDERCLDALKETMGDADVLVRTTAAYRVLDAGVASNDAVAVLVAAAHSPDDLVRLNVVRAGSAVPLDRASDYTPTLVEELRDPVRQNRQEAANSLSNLGQQGVEIPEATDGLIALLQDSDSFTRSCAALALGHVGAEARVVVPALAKHVADPDEGTRSWVAHSLQQAGPDVVLALPQLIEALDHADPNLRSRAAGLISLAGAAAKNAVEPLTRRLADASLDARVWAAYALRSIGPDAIAALPSFEKALLTDAEPKMRVEAARAIAALGPLAGSAAEQLVAAATKDPDGEVRLWSLFAIGELGVKSDATLAALRDAAKSSDAGVLAEANKALAKLGEASDAKAIANEPPPKRELEPVATRVAYEETAMVVSDANGAAIVDFLEESDTPHEHEASRHAVKYRFRFLARGQADATSGTGEVRDVWRAADAPVVGPGETADQHDLRAGPLHVEWNWSAKGVGYVKWSPEQLHVEFVHANLYDSLDLRRFIR